VEDTADSARQGALVISVANEVGVMMNAVKTETDSGSSEKSEWSNPGRRQLP
jgi:hypothetical protein